MITAIVTSDNHLGAYYARFRPERLGQRRRRLQDAFARVVEAAIERKADLFLHAGDLFDRPDPRNAERHFVACQFKRLRDAGIPVFAIAGNHDSPRSFGYDGGILPQEEMHALEAVHLFRQTDTLEAATLTICGQRVAVWGMSSDFNRSDDICPLEGLAAQHRRAGDIELMLFHYSVEGWGQPFAQEPCLSLANLQQLQADAICVGHLHTRRETRLSNGGALLNPGATEHIHFGEENLPCGFWALHCEPGHVETEYVPLPTQPMRTLELDVTDAPTAATAEEDKDPLMASLLAQVEAAAHPDQLLRVRLSGRLPRARAHHLDFGLLAGRGNETNFHCQIETDRLIAFDPLAELPLGFGVSFDAGKELQNIARAVAAHYGDDPTEQEICRSAAQRLATAYLRLTARA